MNTLAVLFTEVVFEQFNEMEKIIEHRRESSRYILVLLFIRLMGDNIRHDSPPFLWKIPRTRNRRIRFSVWKVFHGLK